MPVCWHNSDPYIHKFRDCLINLIIFMQKSNIDNISKVTAKSKNDIIAYVRMKRKYDANEQKISKFIEALWRTLFYGAFVIVGVKTVLFPDVAPWILNNRLLNEQWPAHYASDAVMFYYYVELGAYFHQLLWTEVSRSDSIEMIAHHVITISLIILSHIYNFHRYGTVLLILHDISDVFLESAKCFNYISQVPRWKHWHIACDGLFVGFVITFFVCRLVLFPRVFLLSLIVYSIGEYFGMYWIVGQIILWLMVSLFCLHCFWFYLTIKMVIRLFSPEGLSKGDVRSDDEDEGDDFHETEKKTPIARKKSKKDN